MTQKVFWFSRHALTPEQLDGLKRFMHNDDLTVTQVSQTVKTADELVKLTPPDVSCIAVVLPIPILAQYCNEVRYHLDYDDDVDILVPRSKRLLKEDGSVEFVYDGWEVIDDIRYESHVFK